MRYARPALLGLIVLAILLVAYGLLAPKKERNSVEWLAQVYGVSEDTIRETALTLGVRPEDMATFGERVFPANYFTDRLAELRTKEGFVYRDAVEALVQGYRLRCASPYGSVIYYLYYGTSVRQLPWWEKYGSMLAPARDMALVIVFDYSSNFSSRQVVMDHWDVPDVQDSPFANERGWLLDRCGIH